MRRLYGVSAASVRHFGRTGKIEQQAHADHGGHQVGAAIAQKRHGYALGRRHSHDHGQVEQKAQADDAGERKSCVAGSELFLALDDEVAAVKEEEEEQREDARRGRCVAGFASRSTKSFNKTKFSRE